MQLMVRPGTYVLAVSGGVDSMALLHMLSRAPGVKLVVAHYDHGIRGDSHLDRQLVQRMARHYGLPYVHARGNLGPGVSEATARKARYDFLRKVKQASGARSIITAHHQDDALETAVHNILRGTKRKGLSSLRSADGFLRPLLSYPKQRLYDYAKDHELAWREDTTNQDISYKRNYIRHNLLGKFAPSEREQLRILIEKITQVNDEVESILVSMLHVQPAVNQLDRNWFVLLPHRIAKEVLHHWLTKHGIKDISERKVEKLVVAMKAARPGASFDADKTTRLRVSKDKFALEKQQ